MWVVSALFPIVHCWQPQPRLDHQHNFSDREKKISSMVTVQDAGLAVFRVVKDEETSEDKIEWLLLQSSK